ncbi:MAG: dephospho-CoA kinase [Actinomycetota bacterium]|jgi:dephospho-CoA kinase|nr:dephospho-CoA kinase [Actinomycetota bacterium]
MRLVAVTGGIASGKSTVGKRLAELGAIVIDADVLAREVVEPGTAGLAAIEQAFGASVISADGTLNRPALGAIIFADADKREQLNAITHPAIWARARELFDAAEAEDPDAVLVYDVPLLAEAKGDRHKSFDLIVVVDADIQTRVDRMVELRGMSRAEAEGRLRAQASDADRLKLADVVIDANGSLDHTLEQTDALWRELRAH